ncbi:hypothetical protein [Cellulomonas endometrii]|uniref:hypothetical protein n=1 Tax=Cellulomonas endometrii TaxID=3036301 RepID=UPI0024AE025C|nr:hypothetical protein [Cellulomonas endometrii]
MTEKTRRPTARLVLGAWIALPLGVALLIGADAANTGGLASVMAPAGWIAIAAGIGLAGWASVRKARNADLGR